MSPLHPALAISTSTTRHNQLRGADLLVHALVKQGVNTVFGYPGGAIMPVYDALVGAPLKHILTRHEQGAAFAADGYARATGKPGVCLATSGPGATNLITGIANAYMDSVPLIAITGQVSYGLIGSDAFQEVNIFGMTLPIVKHSYVVERAEDIPEIIAEAFHIATHGRPRPVLIDLPKDIAAQQVENICFYPALPTAQFLAPDQESLMRANQWLQEAKKPLLYFGGGVGIANAIEALRQFVLRTGLPAVSTLKGLGSLPTCHPNFLGMLGMHGTKAANFAVQECDLLICAGARFDDRATGKLDTFAPHARVIHIDADHAEISKLRHADIAFHGDMAEILGALGSQSLSIVPWLKQVREWKANYAWRYDAPGEDIYAPLLLKQLSEQAGENAIITCDVGQHQMWVAQHCQFSHPRHHLTSGGLGAMGYGIPAGIGAQLAHPNACVITVTGDGSIMINLQELATLKRYDIPLKIILLDNTALGMVRQWQELFYDGNYSEVELTDNPDFAKVARAFGLEAFTLEKRSEVPSAIQRLLNTSGPVLMHVKIDQKANVWPLVAPGKSNSDMMEE